MLEKRIAKIIKYKKKKYLAVWFEDKNTYGFIYDDLINDYEVNTNLRIYYLNKKIF